MNQYTGQITVEAEYLILGEHQPRNKTHAREMRFVCRPKHTPGFRDDDDT